MQLIEINEYIIVALHGICITIYEYFFFCRSNRLLNYMAHFISVLMSGFNFMLRRFYELLIFISSSSIFRKLQQKLEK
jgi:hypothetical protein